MTDMNYVYFAKPPADEASAALLDEVIRDGNGYYNALIALERQRLLSLEEARLEHIPDLREAQLDKRIEDVKRIRSGEGMRRFEAAREEITRRHFAAAKDLYNGHPCWWGTKLRQAQFAEIAAKTSAREIYLDPTQAGKLPHFRRGNGGMAATQIQGGMALDELRSDTRVRLEITGKGRALVWVRLGSQGREPRWVKMPIRYHRPLPDGARIKWVLVQRRPRNPVRMAGGVWRMWFDYSVTFVVQGEIDREQALGGFCAVNFGTGRSLPGGIRVAYAVGDDGEERELLLDHEHLGKWEYAETLQGHRDLHFNAAKEALTAWLAGRERPVCIVGQWAYFADRIRDGDEHVRADYEAWKALSDGWNTKDCVPPELRERCAQIALWKSRDRLARVVDDWQRFPGDELIYAALCRWRVREAHLRQLQTGIMRRALERRELEYRTFAAKLAKRYKVIFVEDTDYNKLRRRPKSEEAQDQAAARARMNEASPGLLRSYLKERFAVCELVDGTKISVIHAGCGAEEEWDRKTELRHRCSRCGVEYDQDANAARNILARGMVLYESSGASRGTDVEGGHGVEENGVNGKGRWGRRKGKALAKRSVTATKEGS